MNSTFSACIALLLVCVVAGVAEAVPPQFAAPVPYAAGSGATSVAIGDLDGDGKLDLAVTNGNVNNVSVHRNLGNGTFAPKVEFGTRSSPIWVAIDDLNGDGRPEMVVANYSGMVSVYRNLGNGSFAGREDYPTGVNPYFVAIGDLDGDGYPDLAVANYNSDSVDVLRNLGNATFAPRVDYVTGSQPTSVAIGDLNGDGKPELVVTNSNPTFNSVSVLRNLGNGNFAARVNYTTGSVPFTVAIADLDGDAKPDLAVANNAGNSVSVLRNLGDGTFSTKVDYSVGANPRTVAIRDLDADGKSDLVVANSGNLASTVSVLNNSGNGIFSGRVDYAAGARPYAPAIGDLDGDGRPDLAVANYDGANVMVLLNQSIRTAYVRANLTTGNNDGSSWANAYRDLRTALTDLQSAPWLREIWVAKGTYTPAPPTAQGGQRTASFNLKNNLAIYGGFAGNETSLSQRNITQNPTILSGDLNADDAGDLNLTDNSYQIVTGDSSGWSGVMDGFTITAGNGESSISGDGSGFRALGACAATIRNCRFENCRNGFQNGYGVGGAISITSTPAGSWTVFEDCVFRKCMARNYGGVGALGNESSVIFRRCLFEENYTSSGSNFGPGALLVYGSLRCEGCRFVRNSGGGASGIAGALYFQDSGTLPNPTERVLVNCEFLGNEGGLAGAIWNYNGVTRVTGCLFVGNTSNYPGGYGAGAIYTQTDGGGTLALSGCTFARNTTNGTSGAAVIARMQNNLVYNSIFWGNTTSDPQSTDPATQIVFPDPLTYRELQYCNVQYLTPDGINSNQNPLFTRMPSPGPDTVWGTLDDDYGNLRLQQASPCLDSGSNALVPNDEADIDNDGNTTEYLPYDLDGSPRIQSNIIDRGCYEGFRCPICPNDRQWFSALSGTWSDDPRWSFSTPTSCLYALLDAAGQPYTINFNNADTARGLLQSRNTVTLSAPALSDTLTLRPPGIGATCPSGVPQTFRPALLVSGAVLDNPTLNITSGTVNASSGFIAQQFGEVGTINAVGPDAKLTFASGTCSIGDQGDGTLTVQGGATVAAGFFFVGQGDIDSQPDGVFDLHGSIVIDGPGSVLKPKFSLNITHGTVTVRNQGLIDCGTTGTVFVLPGSSLTGDGTVIGRVVNFGDVGPDDAAAGATTGSGPFQPKAITITSPPGGATNAYEQLGNDPKDGPRTGTLRLRTGDSNGAILADSLVINGNAKIAGTLVVEPIGTFAPATNAPAASLLSAAAVQGRFDLAVFPGLAGDRFMRLSYAGGLGERGAGISVSVAPLTQNIDLDPPSTANVGGIPTDIVAGDFDNDFTHDLDLALTVPDANNPTTAPGTVVILKNAGNTGPNGTWAGFTGGQLTFNVGVNPRGLAKGDFNADGVPDLAVANAGANTLTVLRNLNNGTGAMTTNQTISVGTSPVAVVTGVLRPSSSAIDVAVVNQGSNTITILNNTAGTLATSATLNTGSAPSDITAAQLDPASSTLDLAVTNRDDNTVTVYYRPPAAGFPSIPSRVLPVGPQPLHIEPGGLDNPKEINDLAVTNFGGGSTSILLNNNRPGVDSGFQPKADLPSGTNPDSITLGDLDNDGDPDLSVVTTVNAQRVVRVFRNDVQQVSPGEYQAAFAPFTDAYAGTGPRLAIAGDVNIDGRDDLIAVNDQSLVLRQAPGAAPGAEPQRVLIQQPNVSTSLSLAPNVPAPCPGDLVPAVGDNLVNTADLVAFLGQFGRTCASLPQGTRCGDFNNDNLVNTTDLVAFLGRFGQPCP